MLNTSEMPIVCDATSGEKLSATSFFQDISVRLNTCCSSCAPSNKWPVFLTDEDVKRFAVCDKLEEFEEYVHEKQAMDVYYAKPRLLRNSQNNKIGAFYVLTEECESVFTVSADEFINQDGIQIDEGFIQFYIYSEDRMVDGLFDYEKFMKYLLEHGVEYFDASHVLVPSLTKDVINEMVRAIE